jgi:hypothetical protein
VVQIVEGKDINLLPKKQFSLNIYMKTIIDKAKFYYSVAYDARTTVK